MEIQAELVENGPPQKAKRSKSAAAEIEQLLRNTHSDPSRADLLRALKSVAESIDALRGEQSLLRAQLEQLIAPASGSSSPARQFDANERPPRFRASFSEYEAGELYAQEPGFDLEIQFADDASFDWYRVWNFADAGQALHVLLESCARTRLPQDAEHFTYRRDTASATVYARERSLLERLWLAFEEANQSYDGALQLLQTMSTAVRNE